jgi:hypothetical protein
VSIAVFLVAITACLVKLSERSEFLPQFCNEIIELTMNVLAYSEVGKHGNFKQVKSNMQVLERVI